MKKLACTLAVLFLVTGVASAQDFPSVEIFGGYSTLHIGGGDINDLYDDLDDLADYYGVKANGSKWFAKGFDASAAFNINQYLGIEAAFGFNKGTVVEAQGAELKSGNISVLGGPRFTYRTERLTPFAHFLLGMDYISYNANDRFLDYTRTASQSRNDVGFAVGFGGGLDVNVSDSWAVRAIQADYVWAPHDFPKHNEYKSLDMNNLRLSFGVVYRFGK